MPALAGLRAPGTCTHGNDHHRFNRHAVRTPPLPPLGSRDGLAAAVARARAAARAHALSGALRRLALAVRQALVLPRAELGGPRQLPLHPAGRRVLGERLARHGLCRDHHRAADRARPRRRAGAQRDVPRPQSAARDRDLSLCGADRRRRDPVEVAAQQPVRPDQLHAGGCRPDRPPDLLDGARLDHGLADPGERLAVLPLRGDRRAGAAADRSRTSSTKPRPSTAPAPGSASAMSRCRSSKACCS